MEKIKIKAKEKNAIIESLKAGIVPRIGLQHIQVGRSDEIKELIKDYDLISNEGAKTRFIIGEYGSGKTFFLTLAKLIAHEKNLVVVSADITTERVLCSSDGKSQKLFSELITNISTKTKPDGGALRSIVEKWATKFLQSYNNVLILKENINKELELESLKNDVARYDSSNVLETYINAYQNGDYINMSQVLRWLRAEYTTKTKPGGRALRSIVEKWATKILQSYINKELASLEKYVSCYDFSNVLATYINAYQNGDDIKMSQVLRWLRAEYTTKTEARTDLGVRTIIDDNNFFDYLKLFAGFVRLAGYSGLIVNIDELAVLARLKSNIRNKNFERILNIVNDSFKGTSEHIGFIFGGTPEFLEDKYKGLYSYGALESRLADNPFAKEGMKDLSGPVIRLDNLSQEELYILFINIRNVFAEFDETKFLVSENDIKLFMQWLMNKLGAKSYLLPRDSIKYFIGLLSQLQNYPETNISNHLSGIQIQKYEETEDDELVSLTLG